MCEGREEKEGRRGGGRRERRGGGGERRRGREGKPLTSESSVLAHLLVKVTTKVTPEHMSFT